MTGVTLRDLSNMELARERDRLAYTPGADQGELGRVQREQLRRLNTAWRAEVGTLRQVLAAWLRRRF